MAKSEVDISRLGQAIHQGRKVLERFRAERRESVRQYIGGHWSDDGSRQDVPVNLLSLYIQIVSRNLIAKNPRVMLSTFSRQGKPSVNAMEEWCNAEIERMYFASTMQRAVIDALFSVGIMKVALAGVSDAAMTGWYMQAGTPFAEIVDLDDFVFDTHARDFREASFIGHRFRAPLEVVRETRSFNKKRKDVQASDSGQYNAEGDERIGALQRGDYGGMDEEFEDFVDLWEVYIPRRKTVLTLTDDSSSMGWEVLEEKEWLGPDCGPYHFLALGVVPGNAMPKGPVQDLIDLHINCNQAARKMLRQAAREKEIVAVRGGADADGKRVMEANDGDMIRVDDPQSMQQMKFGGPSQTVMAVFTALKDLFTYMAGNLDIMGGLSPQAQTLGQDRMLNENSSRAISDMQDRTITFAASTLKALAWYWWHDPFQTLRVQHGLPGMPELSMERRVTPQQRQQVPWEDLDLKVDPYSMAHSTPSSRAQALNQLMQQVVMPMMPLLQQQGISLDLNALLTKLGKYMDMPDLSEILTVQEPPQLGPEGQGQAEPPGMPQQTDRSYTRHNVSEKTRLGQDKSLIQNLMSGNMDGAMNGQANGAMQ